LSRQAAVARMHACRQAGRHAAPARESDLSFKNANVYTSVPPAAVAGYAGRQVGRSRQLPLRRFSGAAEAYFNVRGRLGAERFIHFEGELPGGGKGFEWFARGRGRVDAVARVRTERRNMQNSARPFMCAPSGLKDAARRETYRDAPGIGGRMSCRHVASYDKPLYTAYHVLRCRTKILNKCTMFTLRLLRPRSPRRNPAPTSSDKGSAPPGRDW
jgi:hypothetical protein